MSAHLPQLRLRGAKVSEMNRIGKETIMHTQ